MQHLDHGLWLLQRHVCLKELARAEANRKAAEEALKRDKEEKDEARRVKTDCSNEEAAAKAPETDGGCGTGKTDSTSDGRGTTDKSRKTIKSKTIVNLSVVGNASPLTTETPAQQQNVTVTVVHNLAQ